MKFSLIFLIMAIGLLCQNTTLQYIKEDPFSLNKSIKLADEANGFYEEIISRAAPNGTLYVYDKGNKLCHKFDKSGKLVLTFGKAGSGPGEFSDFILDFSASNERLIFKNAAKRSIMLFDTKGKFITDIKGDLLIGAQIVINNENIEFHFPKNELSKTLNVIIDKDGKEISRRKNKEYEEGALAKMQQGLSDKQLKKNVERPLSFMPYNGGFVQHYRGPYKIDFIDKSYRISKTLVFDYKRIKIEDPLELASALEQKFLKNATAKQKMKAIAVFQKVVNQLGGYHPDIIDIIGSYKNYLFVQTKAEDKKTLLIDVINSSNMIVQKIKVNCDEISSVKLMYGYLLINQKNDNDGPFATVYKL